MTQELNIGKLGAIAPFQAKEGTITISEGSTASGVMKVPVLSAGLKKGDNVKLADSMLVEKAGNSDTAIIGVVANNPKWPDVEPTSDYTQAQAISAGFLREVGIETIFKKIVTLDAKPSEGITAGKYLVLKNKVELSSSSGSTETKFMALSDQDSTSNRVVVGFL